MADESGGVPIYDISGQEPVLGTIHPEEVSDALASGKYSLPQGSPIPVVSPDGVHGTVDPAEAHEALQNGYRYATHQDVQEAKYGGMKQQAISALEGAGKGLLGPLASGLELAGGVKPEDIRGREEANPITHGAAEAGTFLGSALAGTGEAAALGEAGKAFQAATGLEKAAQGGRLARAGAEAAKAAFEGILYQGGEELHKAFIQDPSQTSDSVITNLGMTSVLGGLFGGAVGAAFGKAATETATKEAGTFVSELDQPALEAGDLAANIKASDNIKPGLKEKVLDAINLGKEKKSASEIRAAAKALGDAPVLPGMTLESPLVQTQLDALIHSRYTVSGSRVAGKFDEAYQHAAGVLDGAITAGPTGSKADLGNAVKDGLTQKIRNEYAPIQAVYDELSSNHSIIPIGEDTAATLTKELSEIPEFRVAPSSSSGQLVKQVLKDIDNVKTLSDLKILRDEIDVGAMASSKERRMAGILRDKLGEIEENAVEGFAKNFPVGDEAGSYVKSLIDQKKAITPVYKQFITKVGELSEQLGKGKIHGVQDALRFMNELEPEKLASRIFSKGDSEFNTFFSKHFPEEFQTVRNYQRAEMIDKATRGDQGFSPKAFFKAFNDLEPEIQQKLYTAAEIKKINAAETYTREGFPKNFNPSGTSHLLAMREAYASPKGAIIANARDYAIEKAIQMASGSSEGKQAVALAQATIKGEHTATRAVKSVFNAAKDMPSSVIPMAAARARLDRLVSKAAEDPTRMLAMNDNNNSIPEYNAPLAASAARVVNFLSTIKPNTTPANPLDGKRKPSSYEKAAYDRALDIAEQPLVVLPALKDGRITPSDVQALKTMYPNLYGKLSSKINEQIIEATHKGKLIPYKTRIGLAIFLGEPMDSTMTSQGILNAQPQPSQSPPQQPGGTAKSYQSKGLEKAPSQYQTPEQARQQRNQRGH